MNEKLCEEVVGSAAGEMFYKCVSEFSGFAHWSGPLFTGVLLGFALTVLIVGIASA